MQDTTTKPEPASTAQAGQIGAAEFDLLEDPPTAEQQGRNRQAASGAQLSKLGKAGLLIARAVAAVVIIALVGGIVTAMLAKAPKPEQNITPEPPLSVSVVRTAPVDVPRVWSGFGVARAMQASDIASEVTARVIEAPEDLEEGVEVSTGDVLLRLNPTDFDQRLAAARADIAATEAQIREFELRLERLSTQVELAQEEADIARAELDRMIAAGEAGAATQTNIDQRRSAWRAAERSLIVITEQVDTLPAQIERLRAALARQRAAETLEAEQLERTTIRAPFPGRLQTLDAEPGEVVSAGQVVARVVDLSRIEIPVRLPVTAIGSIAVGDNVRIALDGPDSPTWPGRIVRIAPEAEASTRTITVYAEVQQSPDADRLLLPGQFVSASVSSAPEPGIVVPRLAINADTVMVIDPADNTASPREVRVRHHHEGPIPSVHPSETQWAVLENGSVEPGELVVTTNTGTVTAGAEVDPTIVTESGGEGPAGAEPVS